MKEGINMANKNKAGKMTPFGQMLIEIKQSCIDPGTNRFLTNERLAEVMDVSTRMINKYLAKGTKAAVPHLDPIRKLICKLGLHPIDAIKLAQTAGYDITLDTDTNRYLWDKIAVNRACRLDDEAKAKKRK